MVSVNNNAQVSTTNGSSQLGEGLHNTFQGIGQEAGGYFKATFGSVGKFFGGLFKGKGLKKSWKQATSNFREGFKQFLSSKKQRFKGMLQVAPYVLNMVLPGASAGLGGLTGAKASGLNSLLGKAGGSGGISQILGSLSGGSGKGLLNGVDPNMIAGLLGGRNSSQSTGLSALGQLGAKSGGLDLSQMLKSIL